MDGVKVIISLNPWLVGRWGGGEAVLRLQIEGYRKDGYMGWKLYFGGWGERLKGKQLQTSLVCLYFISQMHLRLE